MQTRRQELADSQSYARLSGNQKRLLLRNQTAIFNSQLAEAAQQAGVVKPTDFQTFQDHGYQGLYGGLKQNDIHAKKQPLLKAKILDYMNPEELGANIFRATQTDSKLRREPVQGKEDANCIHHQVGKEVRDTIKRLGSSMPEDLPTPTKSIQQLQKEEQKRLQQKNQLPLFNMDE